MAGGVCSPVLSHFPYIITNLSRSMQSEALGSVDAIVYGLNQFQAPEHCFRAAIPLLCRYSFPTCDPAYRTPTYQPICRRDCDTQQYRPGSLLDSPNGQPIFFFVNQRARLRE